MTLRLTLDTSASSQSSAATLEVVEQGARATGLDEPHRLIAGDNLAALDALGAQAVAVHLVYLDPPFFTQRVHHRTKRKRNRTTGRLERSQAPAFDDRWPSLASYLAELHKRISRLRLLLTPDGCAIIHVDPTTSHYVKVLCDDVFGPQSFASEIVWRYRRWPAKTKNFQRVHDVLLRYQRDPKQVPRFEQLYEPLAPSTRATWGDTKQLADFGSDGRRVRSTRTSEPSPGTPLGDVWEIGVIAPVAKERTGYPTQKPERLLRRVVQACSHPGDLVLDPYVGSGTTMVVAATEGRQAIGIDCSEEAIEVTGTRLQDRGIPYQQERVVVPAGEAQEQGTSSKGPGTRD
jgi:DNA modification methylase